MTVIGNVESVWRYPVKSMRGEMLDEAFVGFAGVYGDRVYAFTTPQAPKGFPFHTSREQEELLLYSPKFADGSAAMMPANLAEAAAMPPGMTPVYPPIGALGVAARRHAPAHRRGSAGEPDALRTRPDRLPAGFDLFAANRRRAGGGNRGTGG